MKKLSPFLLGLVAVIIVMGVLLVGTYNGLVSQSQAMDAQWAQVESQYQRRYDLIPNLVESTKGTLKQEQAVFSAIAEARTRYAGATSTNEKAAAAGEIESALGRLLVIIENYPQLKSNETVLALMDELAGTENRISVERKRYNELVQVYNTNLKSFPTVVIGSMFRFTDRAYFEAVAQAEQAPKVDLNTTAE